MKQGPFVVEDGRVFEPEPMPSGNRLSWGPWDEMLYFEAPVLERIAGHGYPALAKDDDKPSPSYSFSGQVVFSERNRLGVLHREGTESYTGSIMLEIHQGHEASDEGSNLWYWPPSSRADRSPQLDGEGKMHMSLYVPQERLTWLWQQVMHRPDARLLINVRTRIYQQEVDHFLSESWHRKDYYLFRDSDSSDAIARADIHQVSFVVRDPIPVKSVEMDQFGEVSTVAVEPDTATLFTQEKPVAPLDLQPISKLLRWVVGLLIVLILIVMFK